MSSDYSSRVRLFRDALQDALASLRDASAGTDPTPHLISLLSRCRPAVGEDDGLLEVLETFEAIADHGNVEDAVAEATARFESPQRFREALYCLRCLDRDAGGTLTLARERSYLSAAIAPAAYAQLATDQAALLDATTFEALWQEPSRLAEMQQAIERWRNVYVRAYQAGHVEYTRHVAAIVKSAEATLWQADALEKLNRLQRLGRPPSQAALSRYHALADLFACPQDAASLDEGLAKTPMCAYCGYRLGDIAPVEPLNTALIEIERGLATQQRRLHQRVAGRLNARPRRAQDDGLDRFVQAVQSSDVPALAKALNEGLLAFLDDLLATPEPRVNLIDRLARQFPEVTNESLEAAVAAFRALMQDELKHGGGRVVIGREDGA